MEKNKGPMERDKATKIDTVEFGSTVVIILPESKFKAVHAEGFIMPKVSLMKFEYNTGDAARIEEDSHDQRFPDFSNALFKIMPFFHLDSFSTQSQIRRMLEQNFNQIFSFDSK